MSGVLALLDDVAAIAKVAAASVDDVAGQAAKAGAKTAGTVIDDAAVTPRYLHGFPPARELAIVGRIALGSVRNKLVILLPVALILAAWAPWAIGPLLMLGGGYLCFEGAEKVAHALSPSGGGDHGAAGEAASAAHLEEQKVRGAIKTDFILSAEIMTIALAALPAGALWLRGAALAVVGLAITAVVYGGVALIVKADDLGLHMARVGRLALTRRAGLALVRAMPGVLRVLTTVGTAAMLWVGGAIVLHGLEGFGLLAPMHLVEACAGAAARAVPQMAAGAVHWMAGAAVEGAAGLALGLVLLPVVGGVARLWAMMRG